MRSMQQMETACAVDVPPIGKRTTYRSVFVCLGNPATPPIAAE